MRYSADATDRFRRAYRWSSLRQWLRYVGVVVFIIAALLGLYSFGAPLFRTGAWEVPVQHATATVTRVQVRQSRTTSFAARLSWRTPSGEMSASVGSSVAGDSLYVGQKFTIDYQQDANANIRVLRAVPLNSAP